MFVYKLLFEFDGSYLFEATSTQDDLESCTMPITQKEKSRFYGQKYYASQMSKISPRSVFYKKPAAYNKPNNCHVCRIYL